VPKFVKIAQTAAKISKFFSILQDGGRPPSWMGDAYIGTIHDGHLVVFINEQNLAGIDGVVLVICTFFQISRVWLENAYSHSTIGGF